MYPVKQSTALTIPIFVHDASGDAVTALVDAGFTKRISKNGGAFAAMTVTITEMENGWYSVPLSSAHTDTLGVLSLTFTHASAKQVNIQLRVHARLPDDLAYPNVSGRGVDVDASGGVEITPNQAVNVAQWNGAAVAVPTVAGVPEVDLTHMEGVTQSVTDLKDFADAGYDPATNKVEGVKLVDTTTANTDMRGTDSALLAASAPANFSALSITAGGLVDITQAAADKVWASTTRTLTAFSTALALSVWDVLESAIAAGSSIGLKVKTNLDAAITSRAAPGDAMDLVANAVDATAIATDAIDNTKIAAGAITASEAPNLDAAVSSRATPAQVNTEVVDALTVDTYPESASVPAATASLKDKVVWIATLARNKVNQTATQEAVRNDADSANIATSAVSDDGTTFVRGEWT